MWVQVRTRPALIWLVIICLHATVFTLPYATQQRLPRLERSWTEMRLIPGQKQAAKRDGSTLPAPLILPSIRLPQVEPDASVTIAEPPPGVAVTGSANSTTPSIPPSDSTPSVERAPLNLALPKTGNAEVWRGASGDPRANTHISTFGERLSHDMGGDGKWVEERMDADTVRLRRGNTCINFHRNRGAVLDPFNRTVPNSEWGKTSSYRCERR